MSETETKCENCRFWSEMCAQSIGCGPIEALCLASSGPKSGKYTRANHGCEEWESNHHGAIDSHPNYGERARALYEAEQ